MNSAEELEMSLTNEEPEGSADDVNTAIIRGSVRVLLFCVVGTAFFTGCKTKLDVRLERGTISPEEMKSMEQLYNGQGGLSGVEGAVRPTRGVILNFNDMTIRDEDILNILNRRFPEGWDPDSLQVRTDVVGGKAIAEVLYKGDCVMQTSKTSDKFITLRVFDNKILFGETEDMVFDIATEQLTHHSACIRDPFGGKLCYSEGNKYGDSQKTSTYIIKLPVVGYFSEDYCVQHDGDKGLQACPRITHGSRY